MKQIKRILLLLLAALMLSLGGCKPKQEAEPSSTPTVSEPKQEAEPSPTPTVSEPITESEEDILLPPAKVLG